jgi:hypothetical protein
MLSDLKAWEASAATATSQLLLVSSGSNEANDAMGLRSTVVLDQGLLAARSFGVYGTPSALLVDDRGKISSELAVGTAAVVALLRGS